VTCADLTCQRLPENEVRAAELIAFHLPMHTATRLALRAIPKVRLLNPRARLCGYGLYAPLNERHLRESGIEIILGGEFEQGLVDLARGREPETSVSLGRLRFLVPDRGDLPGLERYAKLVGNGRRKVVGYTEASRGCKHRCRHCPIVPVYDGAFRVVQPEVVLEDIARQVAAGAEHITFGDPDFFNGPTHAAALVEELHARHPQVTYDVTIKVEHLLARRHLLPVLRRTGCLFVTSAVESVEDRVLKRLEKGHTRQDFIDLVRIMQEEELGLAPTFVPFTPWTTREGYRDLLHTLVELDLVQQVSPVQLAIRLLIPDGSRLLELEEVRALVKPFDERALYYPWEHEDAELDDLCRALQRLIKGTPRQEAFRRVWAAVMKEELPETYDLMPRATVPYLDEPWYC
jgi:radical SAM superfamily enzyme YgiQ (UPF0313 family)